MSIIVKDLSFSYNRRNEVFSNFNLTIENGTFVSILGSNGSGKSTLALILAALIKNYSGEVILPSIPSIIFQNPDNQIVGETVELDIAYGMENMALGRETMEACISRVLKETGLENKRYESPHNLSGGEKQRLVCSSALVLDRDIIIFDEATSMLDPLSSLSILNLAYRECREKKKTVIYITHNSDEALISDRVILLDKGKIIRDGKSRDVLSDPILEEKGISLPFYPSLYLEMKKKVDISSFFTLEELKERMKRC